MTCRELSDQLSPPLRLRWEAIMMTQPQMHHSMVVAANSREIVIFGGLTSGGRPSART
jgi:hypothetical protein